MRKEKNPKSQNKKFLKKELYIMKWMVTKKEHLMALDEIIDLVDLDSAPIDEEDLASLHEYIKNEIALLDKRASSRHNHPSSKQIVNEAIKEDILKAVAEHGPVTISELQTKDEKLSQYSNQKLSNLVTQLVDNGSVKREVIKRKPYFSLVTEN